MKILVFERNLIWSARLNQSLFALGHESKVINMQNWSLWFPDAIQQDFDVAIVNLGEADSVDLIPTLKRHGIPIIAHAGHKEKDLLSLGQQLGVDRLATNSELTFKLPAILAEFEN